MAVASLHVVIWYGIHSLSLCSYTCGSSHCIKVKDSIKYNVIGIYQLQPDLQAIVF